MMSPSSDVSFDDVSFDDVSLDDVSFDDVCFDNVCARQGGGGVYKAGKACPLRVLCGSTVRRRIG
jgi:hypothetical protein